MKKTVFLVSFLMILGLLNAQNFKMDDHLPLADDVHYGVLDNGLTYYVKHNEEPKNRAYLQLVINAGSVLEDEDQLGLAHMCEHMAFNGTKNFPKHKLIEFLESLGMRFGADLNAYTSFDETVYMIEIPLDSTGFLDNGLLILSDWASNVSYETDEINAERGVIMEEWRLGRGAQDRLTRQTFPALFYNSKYAERLPIGDTAIIQHCPPDNLRRFYNDWYRPDLQAVIIVGDFDADVVTKQVIDLFSKIPKRDTERERIYPPIPNHDETIVKIATDAEAPYSMVSIYMINDYKPTVSYADYKEDITNELVTYMLNMRFTEISQKTNAPYSYGGVFEGDFLGGKAAFGFYALPNNGKIQATIDTAATVLQSARTYGFTQSELDRQKDVLLSEAKKQYDGRNKYSSDSWARMLHKNFGIYNIPAISFELQYELYKTFLPQITVDEVNNALKAMFIDKNTVITVTSTPGNDLPTEQELLDTYNTAKNSQTIAYQDVEVADNLISEDIDAGQVTNTETDDITGTTTWTLSNGITVVLKPTDFKDNQILMKSFSYGGYSLYPNDILSAKNCDNIAQNCGVGDFDNTQLTKYLADKNVSCYPYVSILDEGFSGNSTIDDFETMMQLVYLYFTKPRFDETGFENFIEQQKIFLTNKENDPQAIWRDSLYAALYNNNPLLKSMDLKDLQNIDLQKAEEIFKERFSDPASFTFVFVGNLDLQTIKPIVEKYLGSLSNTDNKEPEKSLDLILSDEPKEVFAYKGSDPKSLVYTILHGDVEQTLKNEIYLQSLAYVLTDSLLDQIRETKRWTYSISANSKFSDVFKNQYSVGIFYSSAPDKVDSVNMAIIRIVGNLKKYDIPETEVQSTIEKLKREHEKNMRDNGYWLNELTTMQQKGTNPEFITDFDKIILEIDKGKIMEYAKKFLHENYISVILKPEE